MTELQPDQTESGLKPGRGFSEFGQVQPLGLSPHTKGLGVLVIALMLAISAAPGAALAATEADHSATGEHGEAHYHKNHVALFLGSTQSEEHHGERDDPSFTIGADYERRLTRIFGVGALADVVVEGDRELLVGLPVFLHAGKGSKFLVAPCVHKLRGADEYDYVLRVGLVWDFHVGPGTLAPVVLYDFAEHHNLLVLGIGIGKGW